MREKLAQNFRRPNQATLLHLLILDSYLMAKHVMVDSFLKVLGENWPHFGIWRNLIAPKS